MERMGDSSQALSVGATWESNGRLPHRLQLRGATVCRVTKACRQPLWVSDLQSLPADFWAQSWCFTWGNRCHQEPPGVMAPSPQWSVAWYMQSAAKRQCDLTHLLRRGVGQQIADLWPCRRDQESRTRIQGLRNPCVGNTTKVFID